MSAIANRYEFVYLFDVTNGNPNGDPDAGNLPRLDPETNQGLVTDVCLKRKIRNYVALEKDHEPGYAIYVQERTILQRQREQAYEAVGIKHEKTDLPKDKKKAAELTEWMCKNFFDVRSFGAVMTLTANTGQVKGPIQMGFATSIEPVIPLEVGITLCAVASDNDLKNKQQDMGRKHIIPYGLYRAHGFISAKLAERTGFSEDDLQLLWRALGNMFEHDRSAARGEMAARKLIVFKHDHPMGNAPAHKLFELVKVARTAGEADTPARSFADYQVSIDYVGLPAGVTIEEVL